MPFKVEILTAIELDGDRDEIRADAPAEYRFSADKQIIEYNDMTEDGVVHTRITVSKDYIDIERDNAAMPCLHLREGEQTEMCIVTDYGEIPIECECERVLSRLDENGGRIHLRYSLDFCGGLSHYSVNIKISK